MCLCRNGIVKMVRNNFGPYRNLFTTITSPGIRLDAIEVEGMVKTSKKQDLKKRARKMASPIIFNQSLSDEKNFFKCDQ